MKILVTERFGGKKQYWVQLPTGATVADLLKNLEGKDPEAYMVVVDGKNRLPHHPLQDNDHVELLLWMAGG